MTTAVFPMFFDVVLIFDATTSSRSSSNWERPDLVKPERFERSLPGYKRRVAVANGFGGGTRPCIGKGAIKKLPHLRAAFDDIDVTLGTVFTTLGGRACFDRYEQAIK